MDLNLPLVHPPSCGVFSNLFLARVSNDDFQLLIYMRGVECFDWRIRQATVIRSDSGREQIQTRANLASLAAANHCRDLRENIALPLWSCFDSCKSAGSCHVVHRRQSHSLIVPRDSDEPFACNNCRKSDPIATLEESIVDKLPNSVPELPCKCRQTID